MSTIRLQANTSDTTGRSTVFDLPADLASRQAAPCEQVRAIGALARWKTGRPWLELQSRALQPNYRSVEAQRVNRPFVGRLCWPRPRRCEPLAFPHSTIPSGLLQLPTPNLALKRQAIFELSLRDTAGTSGHRAAVPKNPGRAKHTSRIQCRENSKAAPG